MLFLDKKGWGWQEEETGRGGKVAEDESNTEGEGKHKIKTSSRLLSDYCCSL